MRARPYLHPGEVHVWSADLDVVRGDVIETLSRDERSRAGHMLSPRRGLRWARAHGLLRVLLGEYLGEAPRSLCFCAGEHGKPAVAQPRSPSRADSCATLSFNLAHSDSVAVYAFSRAGEVGVDVEAPRRRFDHLAVAGRAFGEDAARRLALLDARARELEFRRLWVAHEAAVKCAGVSLWAPRVRERVRAAWVAELDLGFGRDVAAAVALGREPYELECFSVARASCRDAAPLHAAA
jgi:4'-phosphopantetheinyl transferase